MSSCELSLSSGTSLSLTDKEIIVKRPEDKKWPKVQTSVRNVLWADLTNDVLTITLLAKRKPQTPLKLVHIAGPISDVDKEHAASFTDAIMDTAYAGLTRQRRLKVFVNPKSGPGKAVALYRRRIEPIFNAARCNIDVTFTTRNKHAQEIAERLPLGTLDAIVVMSGDGLIHEVLNGCAAHAEPTKAFRIPITPIPTGSGNGLAINLLGNEEAKDISVAALNAIKGHSMDVDLFSMIQSGKRYISFMSQSLGLVADIDLGTEHLRFMGGQRFVVGYIYEVLRHRQYPIKISIKVAHSDKRQMITDMHASRTQAQAVRGSSSSSSMNSTEEGSISIRLPDLKYTGLETDNDGWITFDKPIAYLFAGQGPYVSADLIQFPVSLPNDGYIDIAIGERTTRLAMLQAMDGAERGETFWRDTQHYFKAYAYRVEPLSPRGYLSIDGEPYPLEPFEVEVHRGLGAFLSMYGCYQAEKFQAVPPQKK